jgi:hypothetical protein
MVINCIDDPDGDQDAEHYQDEVAMIHRYLPTLVRIPMLNLCMSEAADSEERHQVEPEGSQHNSQET